MKRLTRDEVQVERLVRAARGVAVLGAGSRRGEHGNATVAYLEENGFDVFPVREDRAEVGGLASWARLADVPRPLDILLVVGGPPPDAETIAGAARKGACAVWLEPGVPAGDVESSAAAHGLALVQNRDIVVALSACHRSRGGLPRRGDGSPA